MLDPIVRRLVGVLILLFIMGVLSAQDRNILIIGIDGLRGDAFMAAQTPTMDHFMNDGEYSYDCDAGERTINGPSWTSILTGVWHKKHNVKKLILAASMSSYGEGVYACEDCGQVRPSLRPSEQMARRDWLPRCPDCSRSVSPRPTSEEAELNANSIYAITKKNQGPV